MIARLRRALLAAVVGALSASLCLVAAYMLHPGLTFEMDKPLPSFIQGLSDKNERDALGTFNWSSGRVTASIPGLDRQVEWTCTIRFRGPRPPGLPHPTLQVIVDDHAGTPMQTSDEYQEQGILLPTASADGVQIVMIVNPTFAPGGGDARPELGIQIDRFLCRPRSAIVRPPSNTLTRAALAAGIFSAGLALLGLSLSSALFAAVAVGLGQTVMLAISSGMYGSYSARLPWLAFFLTLSMLVLARIVERWRRESLSSSARFVLAASASVLFLKLAGLYHPAKPIVDADFNGHNLIRLLEQGRWLFTQPVNDVSMPYAVGLYIFSVPFTWLSSNYNSIVWTVTASADVVAGALLYPVILRAWGDRRAAAAAAVLFQLVPGTFMRLGDANLPNIFGQSLALAAVAAAVTWRLDVRRIGTLAGLTALIAAALLTHISTVMMLPAVLGVLVILFWWRGDPERRRAALAIVVAAAAAAALAWFVYYGRFMEEYKAAFAQMFSPKTAEQLAAAAKAAKGYVPLSGRLGNLAEQTFGGFDGFGLPLLILAGFGVWSLVRRGRRDRLVSALMAWAVFWVVFSASTVFAQVDATYVRYSLEFLGRINLATVPLIAILAGRGAMFGWESDIGHSAKRPLQVTAAVLVAATIVLALQAWLGWFTR